MFEWSLKCGFFSYRLFVLYCSTQSNVLCINNVPSKWQVRDNSLVKQFNHSQLEFFFFDSDSVVKVEWCVGCDRWWCDRQGIFTEFLDPVWCERTSVSWVFVSWTSTPTHSVMLLTVAICFLEYVHITWTDYFGERFSFAAVENAIPMDSRDIIIYL